MMEGCDCSASNISRHKIKATFGFSILFKIESNQEGYGGDVKLTLFSFNLIATDERQLEAASAGYTPRWSGR